MNISYFFTLDELQLLSAMADVRKAVEGLFPDYIRKERNSAAILGKLERKGFIEVQGKTCMVNRVITGILRIMMEAERIPVAEEEYAAVYIHSKMIVLLLRDEYSKENYRLIPFKNMKEFLESRYSEKLTFTEEWYG